MATVDLHAFTRGVPEAREEGVTAALFRISLSVSNSVGDVHRIGKIPHGAIPLDAVFYPGAALAGTTVAKFGVSASQELFFGSATYSNALARTTRNLLASRAQISLSDDNTVRYEAVTMVATSGVSVGHVGDLMVLYKMPGQTL